MITETTGVIAPIIENIPKGLTERRQWVLWRLEMRDDKPTKVPYTPAGYLASVTDLMSWSTFEAAIAAFEGRGSDGIGFVFSSGDPYVGIDLDKCRDPETGELAPWAQKIIARVRAGYIEISPSGTGIHIILEGKVRDGRTQKRIESGGKVEMYARERFFTITGDVL